MAIRAGAAGSPPVLPGMTSNCSATSAPVVVFAGAEGLRIAESNARSHGAWPGRGTEAGGEANAVWPRARCTATSKTAAA
jgi:hypothetical protein